MNKNNKEALLYDQLSSDVAQCRTCLRRCVISPGKRGYCGMRENRNGVLYAENYALLSSACLDPIEKKPLYHFYPGSQVYSLGSFGCSFQCPGCQNWQISHLNAESCSHRRESSSEVVVDTAIQLQAAGICWTYNEPAIWLEYTLEAAQLAKKNGLYTAYVTNGTATREHLDTIGPWLDAYRVDIKAFSSESYRTVSGFSAFEEILDGVSYAFNYWKMHVECVTNVTPGVNDDEDTLHAIANWIACELSPDVPWHITRFFPHGDFSDLSPTPLSSLIQAKKIALQAGLHYVYLGNVAEDGCMDTRCAACQQLLVARGRYQVESAVNKEGKCPYCGNVIYGRW